jgi:hypothetical protein
LDISVTSEQVFPDSFDLGGTPITVTVGNADVKHLLVATVQIYNAGDETIRPEDFYRAPEIAAASGSVISSKVEYAWINGSQSDASLAALAAVSEAPIDGKFVLNAVPLQPGLVASVRIVADLKTSPIAAFGGQQPVLSLAENAEVIDTNVVFKSLFDLQRNSTQSSRSIDKFAIALATLGVLLALASGVGTFIWTRRLSQ